MFNKNKSIFKTLMTAVLSFVNYFKSNETVFKNDEGSASDSLNHLDWQEFEKDIYEVFKQRGYTVTEAREVTNRTVHLVLMMNNEITLAHYQQGNEQKVDESVIAKLHDMMAAENVKHGIVIVSGEFTQDAIDYSLGKSIMLFNGKDLLQMISALKPSAEQAPSSERSAEGDGLANQQEPKPEKGPLCPICSDEMVKRVARKGKNAGKSFWGCSQFPNCRGVMSDDQL